MKSNTTKLLPSTTIKAAHTLRKEIAEKHGVSVKSIAWKGCIRAVGCKGRKNIVDAWNYQLGSIGFKVNQFLWSAECPVAFTIRDVADATGFTLDQLTPTFAFHESYGHVRNNRGWMSVVASHRPFAHPFA